LRAGQTPSPASDCTDGTWVVTADEVRFSREIAIPAKKGPRYPLALRVSS
jgi:hypothetical protein